MFTEKRTGIVFLTAYSGIFILFFLRGYLLADATFWMGIVLIPLLLRSFGLGQKSLRLLPVVVVTACVCWFRPELSWRFLLLITALLFAAESLFGRLNGQIFAVLIIVSPIFKYFSEVFTFPIRLQLSAWAGSLLKVAGFPVTIEGNSILLDGVEFSVDPACMGLQMTGFALLAVIFLMAHFRMQDQKSLVWWRQLLLVMLAFGFNTLGNLTRIVLLVMLRITPDNALHDVIGIVCLAAYVVVPLIFVVRVTHRRFGRAITFGERKAENHPRILITGHCALLAVCTFFCLQKPVSNIRSSGKSAIAPRTGYRMEKLVSGVTQFRNSHALVYIKPIPAFYSTEHSPVTCWTGSGYHLSRISKKLVAGTVVYVGSLKKGNNELLTAWWLSNGQYVTISQLDWRWKSLIENTHFQLINVTAGDAAQLDSEVKQWLPAI